MYWSGDSTAVIRGAGGLGPVARPGLDLAGRRDMLRTVLEAATDGETSVLISSHQLADLEQIADRLLVLTEGQVIRDGAMDELVEDGASLEESMTAWQAV